MPGVEIMIWHEWLQDSKAQSKNFNHFGPLIGQELADLSLRQIWPSVWKREKAYRYEHISLL